MRHRFRVARFTVRPYQEKLALGGLLSVALVCGGLAVAQMPKDNVNGHRQPKPAAVARNHNRK